MNSTILRILGLGMVLGLALGCAGEPQDLGGWRVAFEDSGRGRIGVCDLAGKGLNYITPDSLWATGPVSDTLGSTVYFVTGRPEDSLVPNAIYAVETDGSYLRKLTDLPFRALDIQVTPDGGKIVFVGRYADQEFTRAYEFVVGSEGFRAVSMAGRPAYDPGMAPGGLNFVWHDSTMIDTIFVSSLQQVLTLPIFPFPYTQTAISPDGEAFAAVCGENRRGLCFNKLRQKAERVLVPEADDGAISHPIWHPDGERVAFVFTETGDEVAPEIRLVDINSLEVNKIPIDAKSPTHPAWVR
jgi:hypothetical protein